MSNPIVECEVNLGKLLWAMSATLLEVAAGAPADSTVAQFESAEVSRPSRPSSTAALHEENSVPDSVQIAYEAHVRREGQRVTQLCGLCIDTHFENLKSSIAQLCDAPVEQLEADIEAANEENLQLAHAVVEAYDEAARLETELTTSVESLELPSAF